MIEYSFFSLWSLIIKSGRFNAGKILS